MSGSVGSAKGQSERVSHDEVPAGRICQYALPEPLTEDESDGLHLAVLGPLLELHAELLEASASLLEVRHTDAGVAEALVARLVAVVAAQGDQGKEMLVT